MASDKPRDQLPTPAEVHQGDVHPGSGAGHDNSLVTSPPIVQKGLDLANVEGVEVVETKVAPGHDETTHQTQHQQTHLTEKYIPQETTALEDGQDTHKQSHGDDYGSKTSSDSKHLDHHQQVNEILDELPDVHRAPPPKPSWPKRILNFVRAQWFLITMVILIIIASQVQVPDEHQVRKNKLVGYITVSIIFFITGCTLPTKTLIENAARWKVHLWVQIQCFLITSLLMFAIVTIAATKEKFMDPGLLCGMVLTGCVATTISSNIVMTTAAHGTTGLTVTQSTLGNIIGVFLTPALFKAYTSTGAWYTAVLPNEPGGNVELYKRVFKQLGLSVFIPLFLGQVVHNIIPDLTKTICSKYKVAKLGSVSLLVIIWSTYDSAFASHALDSVPGHNIAFVVFMSIILFILFLALTFFTSKKWLNRSDTVACCYCIPAKSPAIGIPISTVLFAGISPMLQAKLQLPLVLYQGLQILAGTILTQPFANWVDREKKRDEERQRITA